MKSTDILLFCKFYLPLLSFCHCYFFQSTNNFLHFLISTLLLWLAFETRCFFSFFHSLIPWHDTQLFQNVDKSYQPMLKWGDCTLLCTKGKFVYPMWKHHRKFRHGTFPTLRCSKIILSLIRGRNHNAKHILGGRSRHVS